MATRRFHRRDSHPLERQLASLPVSSAFPVLDVVLVGANIGATGFFLILLVPYILCFAYIKKRRDAVKRRNALRKEVEKRYGFQ